MPSFKCKDLGLSYNFEGTTDTEDELMKKLVEHSAKDHGMTTIPPALVEQVKKVTKK